MKQIIMSTEVPAAIGPYSHAVEANGFLYISGQLPVDPSTGKIVEGGIEAQTEQVLKNVGAVLRAAGLDYKNVVKTTCLLSNIADFAAMNGVYAKYYTSEFPARAAYAVKALPMGALVEIETIAVRG